MSTISIIMETQTQQTIFILQCYLSLWLLDIQEKYFGNFQGMKVSFRKSMNKKNHPRTGKEKLQTQNWVDCSVNSVVNLKVFFCCYFWRFIFLKINIETHLRCTFIFSETISSLRFYLSRNMLTSWKSKRLSNTHVQEEKREHPSLFMKLQRDVTKIKTKQC